MLNTLVKICSLVQVFLRLYLIENEDFNLYFENSNTVDKNKKRKEKIGIKNI